MSRTIQSCYLEIDETTNLRSILCELEHYEYIILDECRKIFKELFQYGPWYLVCNNIKDEKPFISLRHYIQKDEFKSYIDCGKNVELFTTLALLFDNDCYNTWFTMLKTCGDYKEGEMYKSLVFSSTIHPSCYRSSTAEEIVKKLTEENK